MPIFDYNAAPPPPPKRPHRQRRWVFLCLLMAIGAIFGLRNRSDSSSSSRVPAARTAAAADSAASKAATAAVSDTAESVKAALILPSAAASDTAYTEISGHIRKGENFSDALIREGVSRQQIFELVPVFHKSVPRPEFDPNVVRTGDQYTLAVDTSGVIEQFEYVKRGDNVCRYLARRTDGELKAWKEDLPLHREVAVVSGHIDDSIWSALQAAGENADVLSDKLTDIFEYYIDFMVDCRPGDRFALAVEKFYAPNGRFARYGDVLTAQYDGGNETYNAFLYVAPDSSEGYYDADGKSLQGLFLKAPLKYTRISSRFTNRRYHPILKMYLPHHGVDYAAPYGTKVWAIAGGVVTFVGRKGALGNYIEVRHKNGYKTGYGHLSRFARGLHTGQRVEQKQTIGYVGATGRATGPHLHFNFFTTVNGQYHLVNPVREINRPTGQPVPASEMADFQQQRDHLLALIHQNNGALITAAPQADKSQHSAD